MFVSKSGENGMSWVNIITYWQQHHSSASTVAHKIKGGKVSEYLTETNMHYIIDFISDLLTNIVHHRNQLKKYRSIVKDFNDHFDSININIDFSENLTVPVKYEPQSLHWHQ